VTEKEKKRKEKLVDLTKGGREDAKPIDIEQVGHSSFYG